MTEKPDEMLRSPAECTRTDTVSSAFWDHYHAIPLPQPQPPPPKPPKPKKQKAPKPKPEPIERPPAGHAPRLPYIPALDGIRALAVVAVLLYHQNINWLPGGFLGVEVFFVLSGYLITSLLLAEVQATGRVDLKAFWLRRARRLLPALYLLLAVSLTYALIFLPDEVNRLRGDALAAAVYITNWWAIFDHKSYFELVGRPSLYQHLWSLAVEEQFYLIWPPLFALAVAHWKRWRVLLAVLGGAAISTILMASLFHTGVDPSRVYYGTDTRAAELLIGAALAFVWQPGMPRSWGGRIPARIHGWIEDGRWANIALEALGLLTLVVVLDVFYRVGEYSPRLYRGGFLLIALATAGLIASVVCQRTHHVSRALGWEPLRWLGLRSYGIYLWHWPVYMVTRPQLDIPLDGVPLFVLRVALTLGLVELSYRYVETPCRHGALGRLWQRLRGQPGSEPRRERVGLAGAAGVMATFAVVLTVLVADAKPSGPPSYLSVSEVHITAPRKTPNATPQGLALADDPSPTPTPPRPTPTPAITPTPAMAVTITTPTPEPTVKPRPTEPDVVPTPPLTPTPTPPPTPTPAPTPSPTPVETAVAMGEPTTPPTFEEPVTAIGDSVMVGASDDLAAQIPNLDLDAKVGLQVSQAIEMLEARRDAGELNDIVLLDIGNNAPLSAKEFDEVMQTLDGVSHVYFLNLREPRDWEGPNNQVLADGVQRYSNATLIDWHGASAGHPELFWDDGIHLRPEGATFYTNLIVNILAKGG
jgi:peptidoglycan/LPS O-acetylase OafA/YrhL